MIKVVGFDHVVLNVADVERTLAFYCDQLGLKPERVEQWRNNEVFFPSVRIDDHTLIDLLQVPRTGENANHICLVVDPADFDAIKAPASPGAASVQDDIPLSREELIGFFTQAWNVTTMILPIAATASLLEVPPAEPARLPSQTWQL